MDTKELIGVTSEKLKADIKRKFRNVQRFASLSQIPYYTVVRALSRAKPEELARISKLVEKTPDGHLPSELTDEDISAIQMKLNAMSNVSLWCQQNGISHYWLRQVLAGKYRFKENPRILRLFKLLGLELSY